MAEPKNDKDKEAKKTDNDTLIPDDFNTLLHVLYKGRLAGYNKELSLSEITVIEDDLFICPICQGFIKNAHFNNVDNITYCHDCIDAKTNLLPNAKINSRVLQHKFKCPLLSRGCNWEGSIDQLINIHVSECLHLIILCQFNCELILYREKETNHFKNECPNRILTCEHCAFKEQAHSFYSHNDICAEMPIKCPLECPNMVKRKDKENHVENICEMTLIPCTYSSVGCTIGEVKRGQLDAHKKDEYLNHVDILLSKIQEDHATINCICDKLNHLQSESSHLNEKLITNQSELKFYKNMTNELQMENCNLRERIKNNELLTESGLCWRIENIPGLVDSQFLCSRVFHVSTYFLQAEAQYCMNGNLAIHIKRIQNKRIQNEIGVKNFIECNCQTVLVNRNSTVDSWREERLAVSIRAQQKLVTVAIIPREIYFSPDFYNDDSILLIIRINLIN